MANSVYDINKGVSKPIEFHGLLAQYIWYLGAVIMGTLILFSIIYIAGVNAFLCVAIVLGIGGGGCYQVFQMSKKYGEHGLSKKSARRYVPKLLKSKSRKRFYLTPTISR